MIEAAPEVCFDLSLDVGIHLESAQSSGERVVAGRTSGRFVLGDEVTWEARHLGRRRRMSVRIIGYERPTRFRDEMISGPFRRFVHDHTFGWVGDHTVMNDRLEFETWAGPVGSLVLVPYLRRFLVTRNETIRRHAERG